MKRRCALGALLLWALGGCGAITQQGVYEGLRTQQHIKDAGIQPPAQALPPYEQYKTERDKLLPAPLGQQQE